jgi:hypothetical protein
MATFSASCSLLTPTVRVKLATDCTWFADQHFSDETKAVLKDMQPWPKYLNEDLNKIRQNNELAEKFCG